MEGDREMGGGERLMIAVPDRREGKKKRARNQTENLASSGLEATPRAPELSTPLF